MTFLQGVCDRSVRQFLGRKRSPARKVADHSPDLQTHLSRGEEAGHPKSDKLSLTVIRRKNLFA